MTASTPLAKPVAGSPPVSREARPSPRTIAGVFDHWASVHPAHPAVLYDGQAISYAELRARAFAISRSLLELGIRKGDRVGALLSNQPEWLAMAIGTVAIGAIFVPLNTWYKRTELAWTARHCGLSALVCMDQFLRQDFGAMLLEAFPGLGQSSPGALRLDSFPNLRTVAVIGRAVPGTFSWAEFLRLGEAQAEATVCEALGTVDPNDLAMILYTSGSTSEPKGVMVNHAGLTGNGWDIGARRRIGPDDRVWVGTPLFYALGSANAWPAAFMHGATLVIQGAFEPGLTIDVVERTQSSVYYGTGNMTMAILAHPDYRQSRIGSLKKGNAGMTPEYKRLTLVDMKMTEACGAYGLTETYGHATVHEVDDPLEVKLHTHGRALPGMEVLIVDPVSGEPMRTGETGLVLIRGYTTPGYYLNPTENAKALRADGFFDTGDLASIDSDGQFHFHSRIKEIIKTGGINVSPIEIEQLLTTHPDVLDAHVVPLPDLRRGQIIVAFLVAQRSVSEPDIQSFVRERAASFKVPHHILFRSADQLPRLVSGKVAKARLIEEARLELS
jgi:fatty-acyl-CoA synthase